MSETVYLGIDLGTSRTSITSSNGVRETVWSYVGYPKDHVARKKFGGRDIIYGEEAVKNRMSLNLVRPLDGGSVKHRDGTDTDEMKRALRDLVEYTVTLAKVPTGSTVLAVIAAAYGLDFLDDTLVIDVGAGTTDLCRVHGTMPTPDDQRTHKVAGDSIDNSIASLINERLPGAQFSINMVREFKERFSSVSPNMDTAEVSMTVTGKPQTFDVTEIVYEGCYTIVPPTVEALQDLVATYDPEFQAKMRNNVLLSGGGSQIRGLGRAIEKALEEYGGGRVRTVEEPQYAGSNGALKIALDMPEDYWKEFTSTVDISQAVTETNVVSSNE